MTAFFEAAKSLDAQKMVDLILPSNASDRENLFQQIEEIKKDPNSEGYRKGTEMLEFDITAVNKRAETAEITGNCMYLDAAAAMPEGLMEKIERMLVKTLAGIKLSAEEVNELYSYTMEKEALGEKEVLKTSSISLRLIRENNSWYIKGINEELLDILTFGIRRITGQWELLKDPSVLRQAVAKIQSEDQQSLDDK